MGFNAKQILSSSNNFVLYYGNGREKELSHFDIAIIEPLGQTPDTIAHIKSSGSLVFAYISIMEMHRSSSEFIKLVSDDFLKIDGMPLINGTYQTHIIDLSSPNYRDILYHCADYYMTELGCDGLFLDTVGDIELEVIPEDIKHLMVYYLIEIINHIKQQHHEKLILQNNGILTVSRYTSPIIDGICWENPHIDLSYDNRFAEGIIDYLSMLKSDNGLKILLLFDDTKINDSDPTVHKKHLSDVATQRGFILYDAKKGYCELAANA